MAICYNVQYLGYYSVSTLALNFSIFTGFIDIV